jgi:hypothetical protein
MLLMIKVQFLYKLMELQHVVVMSNSLYLYIATNVTPYY